MTFACRKGKIGSNTGLTLPALRYISNLSEWPPKIYAAAMPGLTGDRVRSQIAQFWRVITSKDENGLRAMYFPNALVFGETQQRSEPARLMLVRKLRDFTQCNSSAAAEVGTIDVQMIEDMAIASYPCHIHLTKGNADGSAVELDAPFGYVTQIFKEDGAGVSRIIHEHLSATEPITRTVLPHRSDHTAFPVPGPLGQDHGPGARDWVPPSGSVPEEQVREAVLKFWQHFCGKSAEELMGMYVPSATVIAADAKRSEPARLAVARRTRELFSEAAAIKSQIDSLDIQSIGTNAAIASYSFHFNLIKRYANGKRFDIDLPTARETQIFLRDETGRLRIVHEHMSASEKAAFKELSSQERPLT